MAQKPAVALRDHVASLPEPRIARQRWPKLSDMLVSAGCAVLGGAESCPASADCGHEREEGLRHFLELPEGMPSHDPCKRVVRLVDPVQFQACFLSGRHAGAEVTPGEVVASEGKARRRSCEQGRAKRAIPLVRAWATANGGVLGPRTVAAQSNESTAMPELRDLLALKGGSVTLDARGGQRASAQKSVEQGADYVLARKGHPPTLEQRGERFCVSGPAAAAHRAARAYAEQTEQGQGRVETRWAWSSAELDAALPARAWPGLRSSGRVEATRTRAGETTVEPRFYLTSLKPDAQQFAHAVRNHWGIENRLQWTLDVPCRADQSRRRAGHGAENFAVLRHRALNLLRQEPSTRSLPRKRLACALNPAYLLKVLLGK